MQPYIKMTSRDGCPYCVGARRWFAERNIAVAETVINDATERQKFYDSEGLVGGQRTVPQIYIDGVRIGGFTDLMNSDYARTVG